LTQRIDTGIDHNPNQRSTAIIRGGEGSERPVVRLPTYLSVGLCFRPNDVLMSAGLDLTFALVSSFV
jgi:hypothetical protein